MIETFLGILDHDVWIKKGIRLQEQGDHKNAIKYFERCIWYFDNFGTDSDLIRLTDCLGFSMNSYVEMGENNKLKICYERILYLLKKYDKKVLGIEEGEKGFEQGIRERYNELIREMKKNSVLNQEGEQIVDENENKNETKVNQIIIEISFELVTFINKAKALGEKITDFDRLDIQIMQSILEKLSGDEKKDKALIEKIFLSIKVKVMEAMSINTREYKVLDESEFNLCINTVHESVKDMDSRNIKDEADLIKAFENITTKLVVFLQKNKWDVSAEAVISLTLAIVKKWNTEQKKKYGNVPAINELENRFAKKGEVNQIFIQGPVNINNTTNKYSFFGNIYNSFAMNVNKPFNILNIDVKEAKEIAERAWEYLKNNVIEKILKKIESK